MAITLNKLYVKSFEDRVRHLAQQSDTRLRPWVQEKGVTGATHSWGRMAAQSMALKATTGRIATPANDSVWSNRVSVLATYHGGDTTEAEDINQLLIDPNSNIALALANAARRKVDEIIIAAATSAALDESGATPAFPAGQIAGDYTGEIDFAFVTLVNEMFLANNIAADEDKVFVIGPVQARKLLHIAQATQTWYVEARQLVQGGYIKNWMGFTFILSNLLGYNDGGKTGRTCFAMTRRALGLHVSKDVWARVGEDPSISFAWRIYTALTMGATRVEDEQIVQAQVKELCTIS